MLHFQLYVIPDWVQQERCWPLSNKQGLCKITAGNKGELHSPKCPFFYCKKSSGRRLWNPLYPWLWLSPRSRLILTVTGQHFLSGHRLCTHLGGRRKHGSKEEGSELWEDKTRDIFKKIYTFLQGKKTKVLIFLCKMRYKNPPAMFVKWLFQSTLKLNSMQLVSSTQ